MKKILVTGANGQLGKELRDIASNFPQFEFLFLSREDMPIHHYELVRNTFDGFKPDYCVNCAAYTAVDKAEQEIELANIINAESVGILAAISREHHCKFIHISTDYVFRGDSPKPYVEIDTTGPVSVYGKTKLAGELEALKQNQDTIIIRTSWVYSYYGNNFVKTMMRLMKDRSEISVVNDQIGSPTWAADLASFIIHIISFPEWHAGIYHFSNTGEISWYDFAVEIKKLIKSNTIIHPIPTSAYPTPAQRPAFSLLDKSKIKTVFGYTPPDWKQSLKQCIDRLLAS
jgi:dTDP-4-dehydrorhamnose reductase